MEDEVVQDVTQRLRKYRNRYQPLLRCMFTLVATAVPEARLFGDDSGDQSDPAVAGHSSEAAEGQRRCIAPPLFTAPSFAVSVNKTYPLVRRFHSSLSRRSCSTGNGGVGPAGNTGSVVRAEGSVGTSPGEASQAPSEAPTSVSLLPWMDAGISEGVGAASINAAVASRERAVRLLEDFMAYHFLPFAMTHNAAPDSATAALPPVASPTESPQPTFVLRQYINEASRTSSFLFADPYHTLPAIDIDDNISSHRATKLQAVLVDPREEQVDAYLADLTTLGATLSCIIFTHCFVDGSSGLSALVSHFPSVRVISGLPPSCAGTTSEVVISSYLSLRTVAVPAFSVECLLVEVHAGGKLVGLCTGVLWSTDAAPRWDLLRWCPYPNSTAVAANPMASSKEAAEALPFGGGDRDAALTHTHRVLKEYFFTPYLAPLCNTASAQAGDRLGKSARAVDEEVGQADVPHPKESANSNDAGGLAFRGLQRVVVLPTHGGYSNVTNQLDLYWGAHLGDLTRMKHARTVIDTLAGGTEVFIRYNKRLPRLPHPPLFDASRVHHLRQLLDCMSAEERSRCVAQLPSDAQLAVANSFNPHVDVNTRAVSQCVLNPQALTAFVNVVDVRDAKEYHALHLRGSVNVPMSFPGTAFGARRAELWLQCVLVPHHPILALCGAAAQKAEVQRRLAALAPGCSVRVFTLDDLPHLGNAVHKANTQGTAFSAVAPWREIHCERPSGQPADVPLPADLVWIQHADALVRLTTYEHLVAIEPTDTRVVLDVRTPFEFKNGSHQHSVHVELSEMCALAVEDAMRASSAGDRDTAAFPSSNSGAVGWHVGGSSRLADIYMEKMHTTALMAGLPIARQETLLSDVVIYCAGGYRSLIAASLLQRAMESSENPAWRALHIADVSGGAFQIMTQRPDLWRVKDRSIICIS